MKLQGLGPEYQGQNKGRECLLHERTYRKHLHCLVQSELLISVSYCYCASVRGKVGGGEAAGRK